MRLILLPYGDFSLTLSSTHIIFLSNGWSYEEGPGVEMLDGSVLRVEVLVLIEHAGVEGSTHHVVVADVFTMLLNQIRLHLLKVDVRHVFAGTPIYRRSSFQNL